MGRLHYIYKCFNLEKKTLTLQNKKDHNCNTKLTHMRHVLSPNSRGGVQKEVAMGVDMASSLLQLKKVHLQIAEEGLEA